MMTAAISETTFSIQEIDKMPGKKFLISRNISWKLTLLLRKSGAQKKNAPLWKYELANKLMLTAVLF